LLGRERDVVIEIEIAPVRRYPREAPAHALLVGVDLRQWGARDGRERQIAMLEMDQDAVEIVGPEGARLAAILPIGSESEVMDDQLGAPLEHSGEVEVAIRPLEAVGLLHALPGHRHAAARQRIALARELLLGSEKLDAGLQPRVVRNDLIAHR